MEVYFSVRKFVSFCCIALSQHRYIVLNMDFIQVTYTFSVEVFKVSKTENPG